MCASGLALIALLTYLSPINQLPMASPATSLLGVERLGMAPDPQRTSGVAANILEWLEYFVTVTPCHGEVGHAVKKAQTCVIHKDQGFEMSWRVTSTNICVAVL